MMTPGPGAERLGKDALARHLGIELTVIEPGFARAELEVKPELLD